MQWSWRKPRFTWESCNRLTGSSPQKVCGCGGNPKDRRRSRTWKAKPGIRGPGGRRGSRRCLHYRPRCRRCPHHRLRGRSTSTHTCPSSWSSPGRARRAQKAEPADGAEWESRRLVLRRFASARRTSHFDNTHIGDCAQDHNDASKQSLHIERSAWSAGFGDNCSYVAYRTGPTGRNPANYLCVRCCLRNQQKVWRTRQFAKKLSFSQVASPWTASQRTKVSTLCNVLSAPM